MPTRTPDSMRAALVTRHALPHAVAAAVPDGDLPALLAALPRTAARAKPATEAAAYADVLRWLAARTGLSTSALAARPPADLKSLALTIVRTAIDLAAPACATCRRPACACSAAARRGDDSADEAAADRPPRRYRPRPGAPDAVPSRMSAAGASAASSAWGGASESQFTMMTGATRRVRGETEAEAARRRAGVPLPPDVVRALLAEYDADPDALFTRKELSDMRALRLAEEAAAERAREKARRRDAARRGAAGGERGGRARQPQQPTLTRAASRGARRPPPPPPPVAGPTKHIMRRRSSRLRDLMGDE